MTTRHAQRDNDSDAITPQGLAVNIIAVSIMFTIVGSIVILLRIYVRVTIRRFGADDWLMCCGWVTGLVNNAAVIRGGLYGLGMYESQLNVDSVTEAQKAVFAWVVAYGVSATFVKVSICVSLLRIAEQKIYRLILWFLITITVVTNTSELLGALLGCHPISAAWTPGEAGSCQSGRIKQSVFVAFVYTEYVIYIVVDTACVVLPFLILWRLQMKTSLKISTAGLLGLGAIATVATIVRLPITLQFNAPTNGLYRRGLAVIWAVVELNLGIIAGSLAPLQKLLGYPFLRRGPPNSRYDHRCTPSVPHPPSSPRPHNDDFDLVTIGQIMGVRPCARRRDEDEESTGGETLHQRGQDHDHEHEQELVDDESTRRMIKSTDTEETVVEVEPDRFPTPSRLLMRNEQT